MASSSRLTPRQKMINLMYIVFLAMVAMNVSSDVLNGFKHVEDSLAQSNESVAQRNEKLYASLQEMYQTNPEKATLWYERSRKLHTLTDSLYTQVQSLKQDIVTYADGSEADLNDIKRRENLEATNFIMLSAARRGGKKLREAIDSYRETILPMVDETNHALIASYLSTEQGEHSMSDARTWEAAMFESVPVSAAITILTKIQNDIRNAEGETLVALIKGVDQGDLRVNKLNAFVIPASRNVMQGANYEAQIVLAAIDSTQRPEIYVEGELLAKDAKGHYSLRASRTGMQELKGYIEVPRADGSKNQLPFVSQYIVQEPTATVSNTMMNVMYAGIDNPVSISVPGITNSELSASMTNGELRRVSTGWIAIPKQVDQEAVVTVRATSQGRSMVVANTAFRVRPLPDPQPYLRVQDANGVPQRYKGGRPISKSQLLATPDLSAAIDDDLLNVSFRVLSFETVFFDAMGNAMPEVSEGARFSDRQQQAFRRMTRGRRFYISRVRAVGPDGVERILSPMEVIVN